MHSYISRQRDASQFDSVPMFLIRARTRLFTTSSLAFDCSLPVTRLCKVDCNSNLICPKDARAPRCAQHVNSNHPIRKQFANGSAMCQSIRVLATLITREKNLPSRSCFSRQQLRVGRPKSRRQRAWEAHCSIDRPWALCEPSVTRSASHRTVHIYHLPTCYRVSLLSAQTFVLIASVIRHTEPEPRESCLSASNVCCLSWWSAHMSHERAQWTIYDRTNRPTLTYCRGAVHVCTNWPFSPSFGRVCLRSN